MTYNDYANRGQPFRSILCEIVYVFHYYFMGVNRMKIEGKRNKESNPTYKKLYQLWKSMIDRCYKETDCNFYKYGGVGITVCEKWLEFDGFVEDVDQIDGFDLTKLLKGEIALDKDKKDFDNKIYCLDKCSFISKKENNKYKPHQQKWFVALSPTNENYTVFNQSEFAREHGLRQSSIADCLSGKCKTHRGWKFYYLYNIEKHIHNRLSTIESIA